MWDQLFSGQAVYFTVPALIGTGLFGLQVLLMLAGFDADGGLTDVPSDGHHSTTDAAFKILSIQSILAFMMGFGWAGLTVLSATKWSTPLVVLTAVAGGVGMMYLIGAVMASMMKLQASGNVDIKTTVGVEGTVYVTIPGENKGQGQVTVVVDERQRTYTAVTAGAELPRHARVKVVGVHGQNTLNVIPA